MRSLAIYLPGAACAGGMVLCVWLMNRGHSAGNQASTPDSDDVGVGRQKELDQLREELDRLRAQVRSHQDNAD